MPKTLKRSLVLLGCTALAGCASFDGMQEPVIKSDAAVKTIAETYPLATALTDMAAMEGQAENRQRAYRNRVLSAWLMAIDMRYDAFRRDLSRGKKGTNVGLDLLTLGLTGTASVWSSAATELSAAATGVGGARASVDRELYFDKTLPVLISYMDAERLRLRGRIMEGMKAKVGDYSLEQGFSDLWLYQSAGSLDRAIGKAAEGAADEREEAEYDYSQAIEVCWPESAERLRQDKLYARLVKGLDGDTEVPSDAILARYNRAAALVGKAEVATDATDEEKQQQGYHAADYLRTLCTKAELDEFEATVFVEDS